MVLGASADSQEDNRAWKRKFNFPFPLLCDQEKVLPAAYCGEKRWAVLISADRKVQTFCETVGNKASFASEILNFI